jgi:hypothetical protein
MPAFRETVGFVGASTGRDCCIAMIKDVLRAATFALGRVQFAPSCAGCVRNFDGNMVELQHFPEAACNAGRLWHAIWLAADDARYESGPPLATNSPMALRSSRSRCKASLTDTRRAASLLDDARASRFSSNAIRGCWTGIARSSIEKCLHSWSVLTDRTPP